MNREQLQKVRDALEGVVVARHPASCIEAINILDAALAAPEQEPDPSVYNLRRIGWELERTAMGDGYYGNALYAAKEIPGLTSKDRSLLDRYMTGGEMKTDHVALQDLAIRIYKMEPPAPQSAQPLAWVSESEEKGQAINGNPRRVWWECVTGVGMPIYTAPPSREWQDLSPLEMRDTLRNCAASTFDKLAPNWYEVRQFARAIESALRAKNTGEQNG